MCVDCRIKVKNIPISRFSYARRFWKEIEVVEGKERDAWQKTYLVPIFAVRGYIS